MIPIFELVPSGIPQEVTTTTTTDREGHQTVKQVTKGDGYQTIEISSDQPIEPMEINRMIQQAIAEMA